MSFFLTSRVATEHRKIRAALWLPVLPVAIALAIVAPAQRADASTHLFEDAFSPQQPGWSFSSPSAGFLGELNNNTNVASVTLTLTVAAPSVGPAILDFDLLTFRTLDDATVARWADTLTLTSNAQPAFSGAFGSRGKDSFSNNPSGATMTASSSDNGRFTRRISVPATLVAGSNTFTWSYSPLQSLADEAWGLDNVVVGICRCTADS